MEPTEECVTGSLRQTTFEVEDQRSVQLCVIAYQRAEDNMPRYPSHGGVIVPEGNMSLRLISQAFTPTPPPGDGP